MGEVEHERGKRFIAPFNGPVEIGLRALCVLTDAYPEAYSLQRLVIYDYLVVHSDDLPDGPAGLHPRTPRRGAEILVRRQTLQLGLHVYGSRGLVDVKYTPTGIHYIATERSASFLDALSSDYILRLRERSAWMVETWGRSTDSELESYVKSHIDEWGSEFTMESVLWSEQQI